MIIHQFFILKLKFLFSDSMFSCCQAAHSELTWLNEREDREAQRDWSDKNIKISEVEQDDDVSGVWCRTIVRISVV